MNRDNTRSSAVSARRRRRSVALLAVAVLAIFGASGCTPLALFGWGLNTTGQVGDGTTTTRATPTLIDAPWRQISAGQFHTTAIRTDGTLWAWGYNGDGQLGDGTTTTRTTPTQIGTATNWSTVAAGCGVSE